MHCLHFPRFELWKHWGPSCKALSLKAELWKLLIEASVTQPFHWLLDAFNKTPIKRSYLTFFNFVSWFSCSARRRYRRLAGTKNVKEGLLFSSQCIIRGILTCWLIHCLSVHSRNLLYVLSVCSSLLSVFF